MEFAALGLDEAALAHLLGSQFDLQTRQYRARYPHADFDIVREDRQPIGRFYVERGPGDLQVIDISLLPQITGRGTHLLQGVMTEARESGRSVTLSVFDGNHADRLYLRLGFQEAGRNGPYRTLRWRGPVQAGG